LQVIAKLHVPPRPLRALLGAERSVHGTTGAAAGPGTSSFCRSAPARNHGLVPSHFFVRVLGSVMQLDFADELPADLRSEVEKQWDHLRVDLGADEAAPAARFLLAPVGATTGEEADVTVV